MRNLALAIVMCAMMAGCAAESHLECYHQPASEGFYFQNDKIVVNAAFCILTTDPNPGVIGWIDYNVNNSPTKTIHFEEVDD
jgi:hypothetical protein